MCFSAPARTLERLPELVSFKRHSPSSKARKAERVKVGIANLQGLVHSGKQVLGLARVEPDSFIWKARKAERVKVYNANLQGLVHSRKQVLRPARAEPDGFICFILFPRPSSKARKAAGARKLQTAQPQLES